ISLTSSSLQFDVFIPALNIAVEYQGEQHFYDLPSSFAFSDLYSQKDAEKCDYAREKKIHLFIIPYWWDRSIDSVANMLNSLAIGKYIYRYPLKKPPVLCLYTLQPLNDI